MRIKAVFMDLDYTLLCSDRTVSGYTISVLRRCREQGVKVAFATARSPRAAARATGFITWDGAVCYSGGITCADGQTIGRHRIDGALAAKLCRDMAARWPGLQISAEVEDHFYANYDAPDLITAGCKLIRTDFSALPEGAEMLTASFWPKTRLPEDAAEGIAAMLPDALWMRLERGGLAVIAPREATKIAGVRTLCDRWGIPLLYAAAFGDDQSDISMLSGVGWGVAVENALPEVKAAAEFMCGGNDEDGVARWLEAHLLA